MGVTFERLWLEAAAARYLSSEAGGGQVEVCQHALTLDNWSYGHLTL
ncbi:hypothetical protein [uncultured Roseibium sp.]|nr:hypothetical protein [uncultured Roseibium sp.]